MDTFFQARVTLNGVKYEGACYSGEDFAIRSLLQEVGAALGLSYVDVVGLLKNKVEVITL